MWECVLEIHKDICPELVISFGLGSMKETVWGTLEVGPILCLSRVPLSRCP